MYSDDSKFRIYKKNVDTGHSSPPDCLPPLLEKFVYSEHEGMITFTLENGQYRKWKSWKNGTNANLIIITH